MDNFEGVGSCWTVPVSEAAVIGRLVCIVSELPLLISRRCDTRWVPRRGVDGRTVAIGSHEPLGRAKMLSHGGCRRKKRRRELAMIPFCQLTAFILAEKGTA